MASVVTTQGDGEDGEEATMCLLETLFSNVGLCEQTTVNNGAKQS